ncbi:MAG: beta-lactamase class C [Paraglaciecola sp.]|jgi:beta-lactamase class C
MLYFITQPAPYLVFCKMRSSKLIICCLFAALSNGVWAQNWLEEYAYYVQQKAAKQNIPGYMFAFVEKGKPAKLFLYGNNKKTDSAIEQDTVFRLASVSKTFTAMLMAKMVEQKRLNWRTPIASIVPQYGFTQNGGEKLNLQHLIGQSSGFTPNAYDNLIEANYPVKRVLGMLAELDPLCAPGQCYTYQNTLFAVIGDYFDQQNSSYSQQLRQQLLSPLGMATASVGSEALQSSNKWAKPHVAIARRKWRDVGVREDYYRYSAAAGVNASSKDMIQWVRAMLGEMPLVVSPALIDKVTTPIVRTSSELYRKNWRQHLRNAHYGLGWRIYDFDGHKLNYHGGWVQGYRADIAFAPKQQVGYVMLMNAESNLINEFTAQFWQRYFENYEHKTLTAGSKKPD